MMAFSIHEGFHASYAEARAEFVEAATESGFALTSLTHPLQASVGVPLTVNVARAGSDQAVHVLVVTSGVHGVELMAGSGCQVGLMRGGYCRRLPPHTAVVMIHGINPLGAWRMTRTAENLVDLCRNFPNADTLEVRNEEYERLHAELMAGEDYSRIERLMQHLGKRRFVEALMGGQYEYEKGFGFGGREPIWPHHALLEIIREQAGRARRVTIVDLHSGAGPFGAGTMVCMHTGQALARARKLFGSDLIAPRDAEPGQFRDTRGHCADGYQRALSGREMTSIVLELGTYPLSEGLRAVIESHWAEMRGDYGTPRRKAIDAAMLRHHLPEDARWRQSAIEVCVEVFSKALS